MPLSRKGRTSSVDPFASSMITISGFNAAMAFTLGATRCLTVLVTWYGASVLATTESPASSLTKSAALGPTATIRSALWSSMTVSLVPSTME